MRTYVIVCLAVFFLAGCGGQEAKVTTPPQEAQTTSQEYVAKGMGYLQNQDIPRAIQNFDLAIKNDPTNVSNYIILGQVYMGLKLYNRAVDTFAAAAKVDPNSGEAHYLLASAKALDGRTDGAVKAAQRSIELFMVKKDEGNFKKSVALLKTITGTTGDAVNNALGQQAQ